MHALNIVRHIIYGTTLGFSLIVLGIAANYNSLVHQYESELRLWDPAVNIIGPLLNLVGFAIATPVLTFAVLIPVMIIEFLRRGALTSLVATELGFIGVLWVLWLACAADITSALGGYSLGDCGRATGTLASLCSQYEALQAFSWLNWLILLSYWATILVFALVSQSRGIQKPFLQPTTELGPTLARTPKTVVMEQKILPAQGHPPGGMPPGTYVHPGQYSQQSYPPGQYPQHSYTSSQYYPQQHPTPGPMYQPSSPQMQPSSPQMQPSSPQMYPPSSPTLPPQGTIQV